MNKFSFEIRSFKNLIGTHLHICTSAIRTSVKTFLNLIPERFFCFIRLGLKVLALLHFLESIFFFCRYMLWCPYIHMDQLVPFFMTADARESFSFQPEYFPALGARRYFYFSPSIDGRDFDLCSEYGVR